MKNILVPVGIAVLFLNLGCATKGKPASDERPAATNTTPANSTPAVSEAELKTKETGAPTPKTVTVSDYDAIMMAISINKLQGDKNKLGEDFKNLFAQGSCKQSAATWSIATPKGIALACSETNFALAPGMKCFLQNPGSTETPIQLEGIDAYVPISILAKAGVIPEGGLGHYYYLADTIDCTISTTKDDCAVTASCKFTYLPVEP